MHGAGEKCVRGNFGHTDKTSKALGSKAWDPTTLPPFLNLLRVCTCGSIVLNLIVNLGTASSHSIWGPISDSCCRVAFNVA